MRDLKNVLNMLKGLQEMVTIDNPTEDPMVTAYNKGVDAMRNQVEFYIVNVCGVKVGEQNED